MLEAHERCRASIRSLGLSRLGRFMVYTFGFVRYTEYRDGFYLSYIEWRGNMYVKVKNVEGGE